MSKGKGLVRKRLVFHIGGYDPITSHQGAQRRFVRELARFERTWRVKASTGPVQETSDRSDWSVLARGKNWTVETDYCLVRWDDVVSERSRQPNWSRISRGIVAFFDFVFAGALSGYLRTNWQYAAFFLYPYLVLVIAVALVSLVGIYTFHASGSILLAISSISLLLAAFMIGPWRWLSLDILFDDWIFARDYIRSGNSRIDQKLASTAEAIVLASQESGADEILVLGHSLGAVLAVELLDRALKLAPLLGTTGAQITFLSIGSSILKIGLHRSARRFREAVKRVAECPGILWGDYQARIDIMNFYNVDPMAEMSLPNAPGPVVRLVELGKCLEHKIYRKMRLRFYRLHSQFVSGNDKRAPYDYFMLVCGPISARYQTLASDGALSLIADDGSLASTLDDEPLLEKAG
jgi:hypothetical protein